MLRFKQYLNERDRQHPYTDAQINKGLGSALKKHDQEQATYKSLQDLVPKLPDNAAVTNARKIQSPEVDTGSESMKNLNIPKVQAPELPGPFSGASKQKTKSAMDRFGDFMRTGKAPPPTQSIPRSGGPIEIPDMGGSHQATVHLHDRKTGQMDSIPSPVPHQVSVHVRNPHTGSTLEVTPHQGDATPHQDLAGPAPTPGKLLGQPNPAAPAPAPQVTATPPEAQQAKPLRPGAEGWKKAIQSNQDFFKDPEAWLRQRGVPAN